MFKSSLIASNTSRIHRWSRKTINLKFDAEYIIHELLRALRLGLEDLDLKNMLFSQRSVTYSQPLGTIILMFNVESLVIRNGISLHCFYHQLRLCCSRVRTGFHSARVLRSLWSNVQQPWKISLKLEALVRLMLFSDRSSATTHRENSHFLHCLPHAEKNQIFYIANIFGHNRISVRKIMADIFSDCQIWLWQIALSYSPRFLKIRTIFRRVEALYCQLC